MMIKANLIYFPPVDDWDLFEKMLDYIYARHIMSESSQHPVMFSEVSVMENNS